MNRDTLEGDWKRMKGKLKETWGELTDDDLDRLEGQQEQLAGVLQKRYGWARERAEEEARAFQSSTSRKTS
jgi:uncharacterized protein YjbJ (UPF0337 family)